MHQFQVWGESHFFSLIKRKVKMMVGNTSCDNMWDEVEMRITICHYKQLNIRDRIFNHFLNHFQLFNSTNQYLFHILKWKFK